MQAVIVYRELWDHAVCVIMLLADDEQGRAAVVGQILRRVGPVCTFN